MGHAPREAHCDLISRDRAVPLVIDSAGEAADLVVGCIDRAQLRRGDAGHQQSDSDLTPCAFTNSASRDPTSSTGTDRRDRALIMRWHR